MLSQADYAPFGNELWQGGNATERRSWIGKEQDNESELGDFGVRKYDEDVGRFLSVDALWEKYRALTPYQYSMNNPINFIDRSGDSSDNSTSNKVQEIHDQNAPTIGSAVIGIVGATVQIAGGVGLLLVPEPTCLTKAGGFVMITTGIPALGLSLGAFTSAVVSDSKDEVAPYCPTSSGEALGYATDKLNGGDGKKGAFVGSTVETVANLATGGLQNGGTWSAQQALWLSIDDPVSHTTPALNFINAVQLGAAYKDTFKQRVINRGGIEGVSVPRLMQQPEI